MAFINQHEHLIESNFKICSTTKSTNDKIKETNDYILFANSSISSAPPVKCWMACDISSIAVV